MSKLYKYNIHNVPKFCASQAKYDARSVSVMHKSLSTHCTLGSSWKSSSDPNALLEAAGVGNEHAVRQLLALGLPVNFANPVNGWTALHWACKRNHAQVVEILLLKGADPNQPAKDGTLPSQLTTDRAVLDVLPETPGAGSHSNHLISLKLV